MVFKGWKDTAVFVWVQLHPVPVPTWEEQKALFVGVYIVMVCPWTDHIVARTLLLAVEADLPKISKGGNFPTGFHS